eukprot:357747-Chlamydomonas_euryale.AAC.1
MAHTSRSKHARRAGSSLRLFGVRLSRARGTGWKSIWRRHAASTPCGKHTWQGDIRAWLLGGVIGEVGRGRRGLGEAGGEEHLAAPQTGRSQKRRVRPLRQRTHNVRAPMAC